MLSSETDWRPIFEAILGKVSLFIKEMTNGGVRFEYAPFSTIYFILQDYLGSHNLGRRTGDGCIFVETNKLHRVFRFP